MTPEPHRLCSVSTEGGAAGGGGVVDANVAQIQQVRDLLECVWPAAIETARRPFRSKTWAAAMTVIVDRDGGDLARARQSRTRLESAPVPPLIARSTGIRTWQP